MTPPLSSSLLRKRHPAARDDDGWMHGGRYVPASSGRRGGTDGTDGPGRDDGGSGGNSSRATAVGDPSPLSALLPGLDTPLPTPEAGTATPGEDGGRDGRTPLTERLQRLLFDSRPTPTPRGAARTPEAPPAATSPLPPSSVPATPVGRFLESSGVPSDTSRRVGETSEAFSDLLCGLAVVLWEELADWWRYGFASRRPDLASACEAAFELIVGILRYIMKACLFAMPYAAWVLQTCIALVLMVGGTLFYGLAVLVRGSGEAASRDGADVLRNSAARSLRRNVSHSPFFRRTLQKDVPFTAFKSFEGRPGGRGRGEGATPPAAVQAGGSLGTDARPNVSSGQGRQRQRTTPISSILKQTPHNNNGRANPSGRSTPSTGDSTGKTPSRRVLFTETEGGQVSTEQFCYDKHLPPSARKVQRDDSAVAAVGLAAGRAGSTPFARPQRQPTQQQQRQPRREGRSPGNLPRPSVDARSALSPQVSRPPDQPPAEGSAEANEAGSGGAGVRVEAKSRPEVRRQEQPPAASGGKSTEEERKRQYVERYGLLPTITPLSRKYAMSRRQRPPIGCAADRPSGAAANAGAGNKRKRRGDLLGAASRLGRSRRARLTTASVAAFRNGPAVTRKRSHGDVAMSRTDRAVWRAMNGVDKENNGPEESARKRGKFGAGTAAADAAKAPEPQPEVLGTPKRTPSSSSTTPPKTPGPFSLNASAATTPGKTPAKGGRPSFAFGRDGADDEAPSLPAPTPAKPGRKDGPAAAPAAGPFAFGQGEHEAGKTDPPPSGSAFKFGGGDGSAPSTQTAAGAPFKFGGGDGSTSSSQPAAGASFKFGGGDGSAPSSQPAAGASFKFGVDGPATTAAPSPDKPAAAGKSSGFSFQAPAAFNSAPAAGSIAPAPAAASAQAPIDSSFQFGQQGAIENKPQNSSSGFSFQAPGQSDPAVAKKATAQPSTGFSFGAPPQTGLTAAPQTFAFGQQAAKPAAGGAFAVGSTAAQATSAAAPFSFGGAAAPNPPNFGALGAPAGFNLGGGTTTTSEASARRRAKKSGNRRR